MFFIRKLLTFDRAVLFAFGLYKLSKMSVKNYRDIIQRDYEKCRKDCNVFKRTDCINNMLDHYLEFKGEAKRSYKKIVLYTLYLLAHKGSAFDNYVVLKNLPQWRTNVSLIENGSGIVSLKIINGYVDQAKKSKFLVKDTYLFMKDLVLIIMYQIIYFNGEQSLVCLKTYQALFLKDIQWIRIPSSKRSSVCSF